MFGFPGSRSRARRIHPAQPTATSLRRGVEFDQSFLRLYLSGMNLSNDATSPNTVLGVGTGTCMDFLNTTMIKFTSSISKSTGASFSPGSGQGGMGKGLTIANSTWYHVYAFMAQTGPDVYFDTSASAANIPIAGAPYRRLGSFRTSGAAAILAFTQVGDYFRMSASTLDVNTTNPGTAAVTSTLTVPTGVQVMANINVGLVADAGSGNSIYVSDLAASDEAPSPTAAPLGTFRAGASFNQQANVFVMTNTSGQIRYRVDNSTASVIVRIATLGWTDMRGVV